MTATTAEAAVLRLRPRLAVVLIAAGGVLGVGIGAGWLAAGNAVAVLVGPIAALSAAAAGWADVRERRIPNRVVAGVVAAGVLVGAAVRVFDGRPVVAGMAAGACVAGLPLLVVHLVSPAGLGFGDVKFGVALGGVLGIIDWRLSAVTVLAASVAAPAAMLVVRGWRRGAPYGLFLGAAALASLCAAELIRGQV